MNIKYQMGGLIKYRSDIPKEEPKVYSVLLELPYTGKVVYGITKFLESLDVKDYKIEPFNNLVELQTADKRVWEALYKHPENYKLSAYIFYREDLALEAYRNWDNLETFTEGYKPPELAYPQGYWNLNGVDFEEAQYRIALGEARKELKRLNKNVDF